MSARDLDLVTIGRCSVDLYGEQIGSRLEDVLTFRKAVGGCPANIAIGAARLGLRSALISRVGAEQMGRFIREQLLRECVDTRGLIEDPQRLTALVLLGVEHRNSFPMIFVRENCADWALEPADIHEDLIQATHAVLVTGTHFARPGCAAAQRRAIDLAKLTGARVIFDIDYRPNLWGLAGHDAGAARYIAAEHVTATLQPVLRDCDLIVGTEEEIRIVGGADDIMQALGNVRSVSSGLIVVKRGSTGCSVFPGDIPASLDDGVQGAGFPVEVYNVLGAGDAFMAGFLSGWLRNRTLEECCRRANACGAISVSRLMCSVEYPTSIELDHFLMHGSTSFAVRKDVELSHLHHATTRRHAPQELHILSLDHPCEGLGGPEAALNHHEGMRLKAIAFDLIAGETDLPDRGVFLDDAFAMDLGDSPRSAGLWVARQWPENALDLPLRSWPTSHVLKLILSRPTDMRLADEVRRIAALSASAKMEGREVLLEVLPGPGQSLPGLIGAIYEAGIRPDWWLVDLPTSRGEWEDAMMVIPERDPFCRGVIVILRTLEAGPALSRARQSSIIKGFVGGRSILAPAAGALRSGASDDDIRAVLRDGLEKARKTWAAAKCP